MSKFVANFILKSVFLKSISLVNFKSYEEAELQFSEKVNCIVGQNGMGKTNLLDAIYYLCFSKSFFNSSDSQNIKFKEPFFMIQGFFELENVEEKIICNLKRGQRKIFKRNQKEYPKLADHIGNFPAVMISPNDIMLILDGSDTRRKFINGIISQFDKDYLNNLLAYNKVLEQRNALLKNRKTLQIDIESLEIWDYKLVSLGEKIYNKRLNFIENFIPVFQDFYDRIGLEGNRVAINYKSQLKEGSFKELLEKSLDRDIILQYTSCGVHRDDLVFTLDQVPLKKFGSQGQQKSFLIALKLAQFSQIKKIKQISPILLLDDIYDKLDNSRVEKLMKVICENEFGQLFITDTNKNRTSDLFKDIDVNLSVHNIKQSYIEKI